MIPLHLIPTSAPLDLATKRELQTFMDGLPKHGVDALREGLAALWLHFAFEGGHQPAQAIQRDTRAFRDTEAVWSRAAANLTGIPADALRRNWTQPVSRISLELLDQARRSAAEATGGEAQGLFGGDA